MNYVYEDCCGKECTPGEKHFCSRDELSKVCDVAGLINDLCGDREAYFGFNLSKQAIKDEYTKNDIIKIDFIEFLEAFAHVANIASLVPYSNDMENQ